VSDADEEQGSSPTGAERRADAAAGPEPEPSSDPAPAAAPAEEAAAAGEAAADAEAARGADRRGGPRRGVAVGAAVVAVAVVAGGGVWAAGAHHGAPSAARSAAAVAADDGYAGVPSTPIGAGTGPDCGAGWSSSSARTGVQDFVVHNSANLPVDVFLESTAGTGGGEPGGGPVLGQAEGVATGQSVSMVVDLGAGSYRLVCLPQDSSASFGPVVKVSGAGASGPAAPAMTQLDMIPPTLAYQKWVASQLPSLVREVDALKAALRSGDAAAAKRAWLTAHLSYERLGAAYGAFGALDGVINGTAAGLPGGVSDPKFTGFHRIEYGLWHGASASALAGEADALDAAVRRLESQWSSVRMDPLVLGVRAHEIVENTVQFELTARTDYGSGSNLATASANLAGTREALAVLEPVLKPRMQAAQLAGVKASLAKAQKELDALGDSSAGRPLSALSQAQREELNAVFGDLVERLAAVAAVCDIRRTS